MPLQIGHRISEDLGFFSLKPFDQDNLADILIETFNTRITGISENSITGYFEDIKFDFISHRNVLMNPVIKVEEVRLASITDTAAMKINALRNRGTKKDFVDIYFWEKFSLREILRIANTKYPNHENLLTLKSLVYFEDADQQPDCKMIVHVSWTDVKKKIKSEVMPLL